MPPVDCGLALEVNPCCLFGEVHSTQVMEAVAHDDDENITMNAIMVITLVAVFHEHSPHHALRSGSLQRRSWCRVASSHVLASSNWESERVLMR